MSKITYILAKRILQPNKTTPPLQKPAPKNVRTEKKRNDVVLLVEGIHIMVKANWANLSENRRKNISNEIRDLLPE